MVRIEEHHTAFRVRMSRYEGTRSVGLECEVEEVSSRRRVDNVNSEVRGLGMAEKIDGRDAMKFIAAFLSK